jgi:hypothetical protein
MALQGIFQVAAEIIFESIVEIGATFLGDPFRKRFNRSYLGTRRRSVRHVKRKLKSPAADEVDHPAEILEKPEPISGSASKGGVVILKAMLDKSRRGG